MRGSACRSRSSRAARWICAVAAAFASLGFASCAAILGIDTPTARRPADGGADALAARADGAGEGADGAGEEAGAVDGTSNADGFAAEAGDERAAPGDASAEAGTEDGMNIDAAPPGCVSCPPTPNCC